MTDTDPNEVTLREAAELLKRGEADPKDPAGARPASEAEASLEAMLAAGRRGKKVRGSRG